MILFKDRLEFLWQKSTYALLGAFLIHLSLGNKYTLSNVNTYMTSYMRKHGSPRATYGNSIWFSTCYSIGQPTSMVIGGLLQSKLSTRSTCFIGCILYSGSIALTSQSIDHGFFMALLTYSLLPGLGAGLAYMTPMSNGFCWFPERRGIVAGGILAGLGFGPFVFNMMQTNFVNPLNLSPEPQEDGYFTQDSILSRVPMMFILMGGIYVLLDLIGCSLLFEPPKQLESHSNMIQAPNPSLSEDCKSYQNDPTILELQGHHITPPGGVEQIENSEKDCKQSCRQQFNEHTGILKQRKLAPTTMVVTNYENLIVKQAIKTPEFIILFLAFGLTTQGMLFINSVLKKYGQTFIMDDNFLAWTGSIGSLANCTGRVLWGLAIDRFQFGACFVATSLMFCLGALLTPFEFILSSKLLFLVMTIILFGSLSGWVCIFPVHVSRVFGRSNATIIYGLVYLAQPVISILISPLVQYLIDHTNRFVAFYFILALNLSGLLVYLVLYPRWLSREHQQHPSRKCFDN